MSNNLLVFPPATSLERVLDHNEAIEEAVAHSAAELCLIHAVLKQEVPDEVQTGEVALALQKADALESKIQTSAEGLARVNDVLRQEIGERILLERELTATQAALADAKSLLPDAD